MSWRPGPLNVCSVLWLRESSGGNDELIFDGASFVIAPGDDTPLLQLPNSPSAQRSGRPHHPERQEQPSRAHQQANAQDGDLEALFRGLVTGVKDYATKCGFKAALLGLSAASIRPWSR